MKKIVSNALVGLCCALLVWVVWSFADVVKDNSLPNPHHNEYNLFTLIEEM